MWIPFSISDHDVRYMKTVLIIVKHAVAIKDEKENFVTTDVVFDEYQEPFLSCELKEKIIQTVDLVCSFSYQKSKFDFEKIFRTDVIVFNMKYDQLSEKMMGDIVLRLPVVTL